MLRKFTKQTWYQHTNHLQNLGTFYKSNLTTKLKLFEVKNTGLYIAAMQEAEKCNCGPLSN